MKNKIINHPNKLEKLVSRKMTLKPSSQIANVKIESGNSQENHAHMAYGRCSKCSCPGFSGSGYTCQRGGCGHHYDSHW